MVSSEHKDGVETVRRQGYDSRDLKAGIVVASAITLAAFLSLGRVLEVALGPRPPSPGTMAPSFSVENLDKRTWALADFRGQVVLVDFWATWCPPCVASMAGLNRIHAELKPRGFAVVGINQEPGATARVRAFVAGRELLFPIGIDRGPISHAYGVHTLPTSVLIDRGGVVRRVFRGMVSEARLKRAIEAVLDES